MQVDDHNYKYFVCQFCIVSCISHDHCLVLIIFEDVL